VDDAQETAVAGIRSKLSRANSQLDRLHHEMAVFNDNEPYAPLNPKVNADHTRWVYRMNFARPMPLMWAVVLGEVIHDLRSALDHTVFQLTFDFTGHELPGTGFPISDQSARWDIRRDRTIRTDNPLGFTRDCSMYQIRGVGPGVVDYIKRLQPHSSPSPKTSPLLALQQLWNQDKHRLIHFWGLQLVESRSELTVKGSDRAHTIKFADGVLHSGDEAITVLFDGPALTGSLDGKLGTSIAFENPANPDPGPEDRLWRVHDATAGIVGTLLAAIGHQRDPIP